MTSIFLFKQKTAYEITVDWFRRVLFRSRVLSNMALDSWAPHRFSLLSDRLVTRDGIWFMGLASMSFLLYSRGEVNLLVVMYSINVFVAFTLSTLGMCQHWWDARK